MKSYFEVFIDRLSEALKKPLPGAEVQYQMAPVGRDREVPEGSSVPRKSAVTVLLFPEKGKIKLLLIKRVKDDTVHSGQLAFPGGSEERDDQDLVMTAFREMYEEVGIQSNAVSLIGKLTPLYISVSNYMVLPVVAYCNSLPELKINHDEVEEIFKVDLDFLLHPRSRTTRKVTTKYLTDFEVPCFLIGKEVLWGATAMITQELLTIVQTIK